MTPEKYLVRIRTDEGGIIHPTHAPNGNYWLNIVPDAGQILVINRKEYEVRSTVYSVDDMQYVATVDERTPVAETAKESHRGNAGRKPRN